MNYEQNITMVSVILVTLFVLWYVDKEIKILRSDVVNMKEALSINVQMFQKLRGLYGSLRNGVSSLPNTVKSQNLKSAPVENNTENSNQLETIKEVIEEDESNIDEKKENTPIASNDVPTQKEIAHTVHAKKKTTRKKVNSSEEGGESV